MSLHWALALVGIIIVIGVVLITKLPDWASKLRPKFGDKKGRPRRGQGVAPVLGDATTGDDSVGSETLASEIEPMPDALPERESERMETGSLQPDQNQEARKEHISSEPEPESHGHEHSPSEHGPSTDSATADSAFSSLRQIDYWAKLTGRNRQTGSEIMGLLSKELAQFDTTVTIHGLALPDLEWRELGTAPDDGEYKDLVMAMQLVNQGSALPLAQLQKFQSWAKQAAKTMSCEPYFVASPAEADAQAQKLEAFIADCRGALEVAVVATDDDTAFTGRLIESSAKQQGLEIDQGKLVRLKAMGKTPVILYEAVQLDGSPFPAEMSDEVSIEGIKFRMVPALTQKPSRVAKEMLDALKVFNSRVSGQIKVPGYDNYNQEQLTELVNHLSKLEKRMVDAGVEPGGAEALRIF